MSDLTLAAAQSVLAPDLPRRVERHVWMASTGARARLDLIGGPICYGLVWGLALDPVERLFGGVAESRVEQGAVS